MGGLPAALPLSTYLVATLRQTLSHGRRIRFPAATKARVLRAAGWPSAARPATTTASTKTSSPRPSRALPRVWRSSILRSGTPSPGTPSSVRNILRESPLLKCVRPATVDECGMVKPFGRINADLEWPHTSAKTFASKRVSKISQSRSSSLSLPLGPVRVLRALDRYEDRPQHLRARDRGRERPEGPSLAIRASTSGFRASKSGDITFSCGCLLVLKHHTLRAALSSVCNPGGSERRC